MASMMLFLAVLAIDFIMPVKSSTSFRLGQTYPSKAQPAYDTMQARGPYQQAIHGFSQYLSARLHPSFLTTLIPTSKKRITGCSLAKATVNSVARCQTLSPSQDPTSSE